MSNLIEIPARLDQHRRDGFVTCEQIVEVKPRSLWKLAQAALGTLIFSVLMALFLTWLLINWLVPSFIDHTIR